MVTPFGKNSRTIRFRFSLLPRSHGECGWAKYTGSPVAVIVACRAISAPQSQVSERRIDAVVLPMPTAEARGYGRDRSVACFLRQPRATHRGACHTGSIR